MPVSSRRRRAGGASGHVRHKIGILPSGMGGKREAATQGCEARPDARAGASVTRLELVDLAVSAFQTL